MGIGWSLSEFGRFLFTEIIWVLFLFLLCLIFGQLTAMVRLSRVSDLTRLLNAIFAVFRRIPLLAMLALAALWQGKLNSGGQSLQVGTMLLVLFLRFLPDMSDIQMEGIRNAPERGNPEGAGVWKLLRQSLAFCVSDRSEVLAGIWRGLFLCCVFFMIPRYPLMELAVSVPALLAVVTVGYWAAGLLADGVVKFLCRCLRGKA